MPNLVYEDFPARVFCRGCAEMRQREDFPLENLEKYEESGRCERCVKKQRQAAAVLEGKA